MTVLGQSSRLGEFNMTVLGQSSRLGEFNMTVLVQSSRLGEFNMTVSHLELYECVEDEQYRDTVIPDEL